MSERLELHSDALSVVINPTLGARITSLRDQRGHEYVIAGSPAKAQITPEDSYLAGGLGGIDDCLPGITAETLGSSPRVIPDHGEVWCRPVSVLDTTARRVVTTQRGIRGDHELRRTFELLGPCLRVSYELENLTGSELDVLWAAHPLFPLTADVELDLGPLDRLRVESGTLAPAGATLTLRDRVELTRPGLLPPGTSLKAFAPLPTGSPVGVVYRERGTRVSLRLNSAQPAWLGIWLNADGFPADNPVSHLALEPSFGNGDALSQAIANDTCLRVGPGSAFAWSLEYAVDGLS